MPRHKESGKVNSILSHIQRQRPRLLQTRRNTSPTPLLVAVNPPTSRGTRSEVKGGYKYKDLQISAGLRPDNPFLCLGISTAHRTTGQILIYTPLPAGNFGLLSPTARQVHCLARAHSRPATDSWHQSETQHQEPCLYFSRCCRASVCRQPRPSPIRPDLRPCTTPPAQSVDWCHRELGR